LSKLNELGLLDNATANLQLNKTIIIILK
jgi:hypothetical protein